MVAAAVVMASAAAVSVAAAFAVADLAMVSIPDFITAVIPAIIPITKTKAVATWFGSASRRAMAGGYAASKSASDRDQPEDFSRHYVLPLNSSGERGRPDDRPAAAASTRSRID